jgi:hypothetical protein
MVVCYTAPLGSRPGLGSQGWRQKDAGVNPNECCVLYSPFGKQTRPRVPGMEGVCLRGWRQKDAGVNPNECCVIQPLWEADQASGPRDGRRLSQGMESERCRGES